LIKVYIERNQL